MRQTLHDGKNARVHFAVFGGRHRLRRVHGKSHLIRKEVAEEVHERGDGQRYVEAVAASDKFSAGQQQTAQNSEQQCSFETVHRDLLP